MLLIPHEKFVTVYLNKIDLLNGLLQQTTYFNRINS